MLGCRLNANYDHAKLFPLDFWLQKVLKFSYYEWLTAKKHKAINWLTIAMMVKEKFGVICGGKRLSLHRAMQAQDHEGQQNSI